MTTLNFNYSEYNPKFTFKAKDPLSALSHFIGFLCSIVLSPVLLIHLSNKGASHIEMISLGILSIGLTLIVVPLIYKLVALIITLIKKLYKKIALIITGGVFCEN